MQDPGRQRISIADTDGNLPAKTYDELLADHRARKEKDKRYASEGQLLSFRGIPDGKDAYNPSGPFIHDGRTYQWARIESRDAQDAVAMLFMEVDAGVYERVSGLEPLPLEDPFTSRIGDEFVVGGVEIRKDERGTVVGYRTLFYRGMSPESLKRFSCGPDGMKDIRLCELPIAADRKAEAHAIGAEIPRIVIFTRPYVPEAGHIVGRVAMTRIGSLDELTPERLAPERTEVIPGLFAPAEWGGVNDTYPLPNGLVGVLCHVSKFDARGKRHYAAAAFVIDPASREYSPLEMIAERGDFPMGPVKVMPEYLDNPEMHDDLADVIFSARLSAEGGDDLSSVPVLLLTCGLSDAAAGVRPVPNPFTRLCTAYFPERA